MLKLLNLLAVLQIFLPPGYTQADINQRNYQPNFDETNNPQWSSKVIKDYLENHHGRHVKPCLSRKMFRDPTQESPNGEWIPTFKATITRPLVKDFVSQSLKEEDQVSELNARNEDQIFDKKLNTLAISAAPSYPSKETDCQFKIYNQNVFRRTMPDAVEEPIEKHINLGSSQEEENISNINVEETTDECNEKKDTILNSRRSDSNNENLLPVFNGKNNNTKERRIVMKDENDVTNSIDNDEGKHYNNNNKQELRNGYGVTKMIESSVILLHNSRTCYACSSASDPNCWHPSRRTTIKYCRKGHEACITRTFTSSRGLILTRDCGRSCEEISFPGLAPNYKSCIICHNDLCNGASIVKDNYLIFIMLLITIIKYSV